MIERIERLAEELGEEVLLLEPLGTLGTAGVAAGAFGVFLYRGGEEAIDDFAQFSSEQIVELAHFVEQVSPEALQDFARLIAESRVGIAAFSVSAAVLLLQALRVRGIAVRDLP